MSSLALDRKDVALVLVDVQQRLVPAMPEERLRQSLRNCLVLIEAAARMQMPLAVSEQNPGSLGPTLPVLLEAAGKVVPRALIFDKMTFSCAGAPLFEQFLSGGRRTLVVIGMETHICVYQTVRDLTARGFTVHVPSDAVLSRSDANWRVGLDLMARAGAVITSTETVIFDLMKQAGTDEFRALSKLIK